MRHIEICSKAIHPLHILLKALREPLQNAAPRHIQAGWC